MDLSTTYLGLSLKNPVVPSSSPLSESIDSILLMEDAGAAAIVMHSLFEEQLALEQIPKAHMRMWRNEHRPGNMAVLVSAPVTGLRTYEDVLEIIELERPEGVIVQYGGQTPLKLARDLEAAGAPIIGTSPESIDLAEDRERFQQLVHQVGLK